MKFIHQWSRSNVEKADMKTANWISAYENNIVQVGLDCGFSGVAQIGKGMYAEPDNMAKMLKEKISHLEAGSNCAWVPSPTALPFIIYITMRLIFRKTKKNQK